LFVQVIAVTLLPAALVFLILLLNSEELMGKHKNSFAQNIVSYSIVAMIVALSTLYGLSVLFPGMFG
jgi:Mn2+/Fe2+ NRAMP family transporter